MKKLIVFFFINFNFFVCHAYFEPQEEQLPIPDKTELIKEDVRKDIIETYEYKFITELNFDEITSFYRDFFLNLGFWEVRGEDKDSNTKHLKTLNFTKGVVQRAEIIFFPPHQQSEEKKAHYTINFFDLKDILLLSSLEFRQAQPFNNLPIPPSVVEGVSIFEGREIKTPYSTIYLAKGKFEEIVDFYQKNLSRLKWNLKKNKTFEGKSNLFTALSHKPEHLKFYTDAKLDPTKLYPEIEVDVKGVFLEYEKDNELFIVTIVKFCDPPEVLKKMRINPAPFIRYGDIFISVVNYDKATEEKFLNENTQRASKIAESLHNYFGL
ncbi:MAG: hypothetical protein NC918_06030 [Candidatus Omnitrophica bacterium]|nr:hypothetical protein [Candidatus Omnitrophota bacterium]